MAQKRQPKMDELGHARVENIRANFRRIERREWWLWATAFVITLLITLTLAYFVVVGQSTEHRLDEPYLVPRAIRGLIGLVLIFDLYTIYQHLLIHRIRRQLMEREELFHLISANAADMISVVDMEGHRLFNSLSYQKVLGYSVEELRNSSAFEQIHPEDRERVKNASEDARKSGIGKTLEYRFHHKNGAWLVLESTSSVIRNSLGQPEKLVIVNRDITERKKAEEALQRSEGHFRSVVEDAPYGIYRASNTGVLLHVNPALRKMLGYEREEELLGKNLGTDVFRQNNEYRRVTELLASTEEIKGVEVEWKRQDDAIITVRCSGRRVKDESGLPAYFEVFAEDVTEKRQLEQQLRMAQKMEAVGRLSGGIAHDFNNLLGIIIGYSRVLRKALGAGNALCEHALEIEKAGQRAASLTKQLLAFSRKQVLAPTVLNLNTVVSDLEKMLPRLLGEDIQVTLALDSNLGSVKADQSQIEQVIINLCVNARDAMPKGGRLKIETCNLDLDLDYVRSHPGAKAGKYISLAVIDSGTGMDPETLAHIFEPFFTTKEQGKGTGLGLATVYGIVKQSDGYIAVESAPNKGTCFQIYLPRHVGAAEAKQQNMEPTEALHGSECILVVEDTEPLRKLTQTILQAAGFRVLSAGSGEEALKVAAEFPGAINLLLTDVVMTGMSGRALAEQLSVRQPRIKVLYMSGYTESFIAKHGVLDAGTHLLHKPFTEETLICRVREILDDARQPADAVAEFAGGNRSRN